LERICLSEGMMAQLAASQYFSWMKQSMRKTCPTHLDCLWGREIIWIRLQLEWYVAWTWSECTCCLARPTKRSHSTLIRIPNFHRHLVLLKPLMYWIG
jgi:hypothetical protein